VLYSLIGGENDCLDYAKYSNKDVNASAQTQQQSVNYKLTHARLQHWRGVVDGAAIIASQHSF